MDSGCSAQTCLPIQPLERRNQESGLGSRNLVKGIQKTGLKARTELSVSVDQEDEARRGSSNGCVSKDADRIVSHLNLASENQSDS